MWSCDLGVVENEAVIVANSKSGVEHRERAWLRNLIGQSIIKVDRLFFAAGGSSTLLFELHDPGVLLLDSSDNHSSHVE